MKWTWLHCCSYPYGCLCSHTPIFLSCLIQEEKLSQVRAEKGEWDGLVVILAQNMARAFHVIPYIIWLCAVRDRYVHVMWLHRIVHLNGSCMYVHARMSYVRSCVLSGCVIACQSQNSPVVDLYEHPPLYDGYVSKVVTLFDSPNMTFYIILILIM